MGANLDRQLLSRTRAHCHSELQGTARRKMQWSGARVMDEARDKLHAWRARSYYNGKEQKVVTGRNKLAHVRRKLDWEGTRAAKALGAIPAYRGLSVGRHNHERMKPGGHDRPSRHQVSRAEPLPRSLRWRNGGARGSPKCEQSRLRAKATSKQIGAESSIPAAKNCLLSGLLIIRMGNRAGNVSAGAMVSFVGSHFIDHNQIMRTYCCACNTTESGGSGLHRVISMQ